MEIGDGDEIVAEMRESPHADRRMLSSAGRRCSVVIRSGDMSCNRPSSATPQ